MVEPHNVSVMAYVKTNVKFGFLLKTKRDFTLCLCCDTITHSHLDIYSAHILLSFSMH